MSIHDLQVLLALSFGSIVDAGSVVKFCSLFCSELRRESTVDWPEERCLYGTALSGQKSRAGKHELDLYSELHKGRPRFPSCLRDYQRKSDAVLRSMNKVRFIEWRRGIVDDFLVGTGVIFFLFIIYKFPVSIMHIVAGQPSSSTWQEIEYLYVNDK